MHSEDGRALPSQIQFSSPGERHFITFNVGGGYLCCTEQYSVHWSQIYLFSCLEFPKFCNRYPNSTSQTQHSAMRLLHHIYYSWGLGG